ncbi:MAG: fibronectin type III-like domain-contianing protein, partial [Acidobacteriaceae bacterium]|nr:fibronectin type III-like domain-contianing protein [Acidobacteriaceae bacterium]
YPFGYGLSYSEFQYSGSARKDLADSKVELSAIVTNTSERDGDEVAELYVTSPDSIALRGFERVHVRAGESRVVTFVIKGTELDGKTFYIGGGQPNAPRS